MRHIIFYAINGVGLGHTARLSGIQQYLSANVPALDIHIYAQSRYAPVFFTCPCTHVPTQEDFKKALKLKGLRKFYEILSTRCCSSKQKTFIFDTYWPERRVRYLKACGHHLILIQRGFKPDDMYKTLQKSVQQFDHIFFPCEQDEIDYCYKEHQELCALIAQHNCEAIGPIVRLSDTRDETEKVIFTVGGGGDHENEDPRYRVQSYLKHYVKTADILHEAGKTNLYLAKGPMMKVDIDLGHLQILETLKLPEHFGANTSVVTRGTYNLSWETIAAGAKLITTTRSGVDVENSDIRNQYLMEKGYAYCSPLDAQALAEAIMDERPPNLDEGKQLVNARPCLARLAEVVSEGYF